MIQDFCFETDNTKDFESMLNLIVGIAFDGQPSYFAKEEPSFWPDGNDGYEAFWKEMPIVVKHGKKFIIAQENQTFGGAKFAPAIAETEDAEIAAAAARNLHGPNPKAKRMWIATIDDAKGTRISSKKIVSAIMEKVWAANPDDFYEKFGDGFHEGFNDGDVDVGYGWRIEANHSPWPKLHVSMVHIYYGK